MNKYLYKFFILLCMPLLLQAQEESKKSLLESLAQPKLNINSAYMDRSKIKDSEGSVQVIKNSVRINNSFTSFGYTNWKFDWDKVSALPFGDKTNNPIEQMHGINLGFSKAYRINERWFSLSSISLNATFEDEIDNSISVGVFSFASYIIDKDHAVQVGLFGSYHPVNSIFLPIASYSYRANHKDGIQVIIGFPHTHIGYHINRDTLIRLGFVFSTSLIRLSDDSAIEPEGFNQFQDYMGSLGVSYDFSEKVKIKADFMYSLTRDITTYDKHSKELNNYKIDPSAGLMFNIMLQL